MGLDLSEYSVIKTFAEDMPGGFFVYQADEKEEILFVNQAMIQIFGCETEEEFQKLTGNTFRGMLHPEDIERVENSIIHQIEHDTKKTDYVEYRIIRKDGKIRWIEEYGKFLHTEEYGDIFCVFATDGTERLKKRVEDLEKINRDLTASYMRESQYRQVVLSDTTSSVEVNLSKDEFVLTANQIIDGQSMDYYEFAENLHFDKFSQFIQSWCSRVDEEMREDFLAFFNISRLLQSYECDELIQSGDMWRYDLSDQRRLIRFTVYLGQNDSTGDVVALIVSRDMTGEAVKQTLQLDTIHKLLNRDSHRTEYIVDTSGECDLMQVLDKLDQAIRDSVERKQINFLIDYRKVSHFVIQTDAMALREILFQILDNAIKYTQPHGDIVLALEEKENDQEPWSEFCFMISDNGRGIRESFREKMFEPFEREKSVMESGILGLGVGLAIVNNLTEMVGAECEVESKSGEGTTFWVRLKAKWQS